MIIQSKIKDYPKTHPIRRVFALADRLNKQTEKSAILGARCCGIAYKWMTQPRLRSRAIKALKEIAVHPDCSDFLRQLIINATKPKAFINNDNT